MRPLRWVEILITAGACLAASSEGRSLDRAGAEDRLWAPSKDRNGRFLRSNGNFSTMNIDEMASVTTGSLVEVEASFGPLDAFADYALEKAAQTAMLEMCSQHVKFASMPVIKDALRQLKGLPLPTKRAILAAAKGALTTIGKIGFNVAVSNVLGIISAVVKLLASLASASVLVYLGFHVDAMSDMAEIVCMRQADVATAVFIADQRSVAPSTSKSTNKKEVAEFVKEAEEYAQLSSRLASFQADGDPTQLATQVADALSRFQATMKKMEPKQDGWRKPAIIGIFEKMERVATSAMNYARKRIGFQQHITAKPVDTQLGDLQKRITASFAGNEPVEERKVSLTSDARVVVGTLFEAGEMVAEGPLEIGSTWRRWQSGKRKDYPFGLRIFGLPAAPPQRNVAVRLVANSRDIEEYFEPLKSAGLVWLDADQNCRAEAALQIGPFYSVWPHAFVTHEHLVAFQAPRWGLTQAFLHAQKTLVPRSLAGFAATRGDRFLFTVWITGFEFTAKSLVGEGGARKDHVIQPCVHISGTAGSDFSAMRPSDEGLKPAKICAVTPLQALEVFCTVVNALRSVDHTPSSTSGVGVFVSHSGQFSPSELLSASKGTLYEFGMEPRRPDFVGAVCSERMEEAIKAGQELRFSTGIDGGCSAKEELDRLLYLAKPHGAPTKTMPGPPTMVKPHGAPTKTMPGPPTMVKPPTECRLEGSMEEFLEAVNTQRTKQLGPDMLDFIDRAAASLAGAEVVTEYCMKKLNAKLSKDKPERDLSFEEWVKKMNGEAIEDSPGLFVHYGELVRKSATGIPDNNINAIYMDCNPELCYQALNIATVRVKSLDKISSDGDSVGPDPVNDVPVDKPEPGSAESVAFAKWNEACGAFIQNWRSESIELVRSEMVAQPTFPTEGVDVVIRECPLDDKKALAFMEQCSAEYSRTLTAFDGKPLRPAADGDRETQLGVGAADMAKIDRLVEEAFNVRPAAVSEGARQDSRSMAEIVGPEDMDEAKDRAGKFKSIFISAAANT